MFKFFRVTLIAATASFALGGQIAKADPGDIKWYVTGTFADGGTLSGYFTVNVSGYPTLGTFLHTSTSGSFGQDFADGNLSENQTDPDTAPAAIAFAKDSYAEVLRLTFADLLKVGSTHNDLVVASSYECKSFSVCVDPTDGPANYRHLVSGFASINPISNVPEPASWGMMIVGFGVAGAAMRRAKVRTVTYAA